MTLQDALRTPAEHAARVQSAPHYANYPNQYRDDVTVSYTHLRAHET